MHLNIYQQTFINKSMLKGVDYHMGKTEEIHIIDDKSRDYNIKV